MVRAITKAVLVVLVVLVSLSYRTLLSESPLVNFKPFGSTFNSLEIWILLLQHELERSHCCVNHAVSQSALSIFTNLCYRTRVFVRFFAFVL